MRMMDLKLFTARLSKPSPS